MKLKNAAMSETVRQDANMRFACIEDIVGWVDGVAGPSFNQPLSIFEAIRLTCTSCGVLSKGWQ